MSVGLQKFISLRIISGLNFRYPVARSFELTLGKAVMSFRMFATGSQSRTCAALSIHIRMTKLRFRLKLSSNGAVAVEVIDLLALTFPDFLHVLWIDIRGTLLIVVLDLRFTAIGDIWRRSVTKVTPFINTERGETFRQRSLIPRIQTVVRN